MGSNDWQDWWLRACGGRGNQFEVGQHPSSRRLLTSSKSTGPPLGWRGSSWPLISFDRDFRSFQPQGLDLWLLPPAA
jgi:hypothetical protein